MVEYTNISIPGIWNILIRCNTYSRQGIIDKQRIFNK